jgi:amino acid transporter
MLCALVLAIPSMDAAAAQGASAFPAVLRQVLPAGLRAVLMVGIGIAQYFCGLATLTSASRMTFAFARDDGLPLSVFLKRVSPRFRTPAFAIWVVALLTTAFAVYTPVYATITAASVIFLYLSYLLPTWLGFRTFGRSWVRMGPWNVGRAYRPLALACIVGGGIVIAVGVAPPNGKNVWIVLVTVAVMAVAWFALERRRFAGPPVHLSLAGREPTVPDATSDR